MSWACNILVQRWRWIIPVVHEDLNGGHGTWDPKLPRELGEIFVPVHPDNRGIVHTRFRPDRQGTLNIAVRYAIRMLALERY